MYVYCRGATRFLGVGGAKGENRPQAGKKFFAPPTGGGKFSVLPPPCGGGKISFQPNCTSVKDCDVINQYILQQLIDNVLNFYYSSSNFIIQLYTFSIWICALSIWTGFIQLLQAYNMKYLLHQKFAVSQFLVTENSLALNVRCLSWSNNSTNCALNDRVQCTYRSRIYQIREFRKL